jgi:mRNA interferase HigB
VSFWGRRGLIAVPAGAASGGYTIRDDGNQVRLIAAIHHNFARVYVRAVLTHAEYDHGQWREE